MSDFFSMVLKSRHSTNPYNFTNIFENQKIVMKFFNENNLINIAVDMLL